jgi:hypothetical protein
MYPEGLIVRTGMCGFQFTGDNFSTTRRAYAAAFRQDTSINIMSALLSFFYPVLSLSRRERPCSTPPTVRTYLGDYSLRESLRMFRQRSL